MATAEIDREITDLDGIHVARRDTRLKPQPGFLLHPAMESEYTDLLCAAKAKARVEYEQIKKNATGNYGKYATLDEVLAAVNEANSKHGLEVASKSIIIGDQEWCVTTLRHVSGQFERSANVIRANPSKPQDLLAWTTYLRRKQTAELCGVAADSDNDGADLKGAGEKRGPSPVTLAAQAIRSATSQKDRDAALARAALSVAAGRISDEEFDSLTTLRDSLTAKETAASAN